MAVDQGCGVHDSGDLQSFISSQLDRFHGQLSETDKGLTLASFDGTGRAIRCALSVRDYCRERDLSCQIGLHVGECHRTGNSVSGAPVDTSRAVAKKTASGEISVTRTVRDLVTGFDLDDGHVTSLDDVDGEWTLYTVLG